jgi:hypothetical protein
MSHAIMRPIDLCSESYKMEELAHACEAIHLMPPSATLPRLVLPTESKRALKSRAAIASDTRPDPTARMPYRCGW